MMLLASWALGHGETFEVAAISVLPGDPSQIWAVVRDQGIAWTTDGGANWEWACEEALGATRVYDILALSDRLAVVATLYGPVRVDLAAGTAEPWPGWPADTYSDHIARTEDGFLIGGIGPDVGAFWNCNDEGCVATTPNDGTLFPKSIRRAGAGWYATVVTEETLASALWWSGDGLTWTERYAWPDGDVDPRVILVDGDVLYLSLVPRDEPDVSRVVRSEDGGATWQEISQSDVFTTFPAAMVATGESLLLGGEGAATQRSTDGGVTWKEESLALPRLLCGDLVDGTGYLCAEHVYDGIDVARSTDGWTWTPIACLETATLPSWAAESCADAELGWVNSVALGGGRCDEVINPPAVPPAAEGCGTCAGADDTAALLLLPLFVPLFRRRSHAR